MNNNEAIIDRIKGVPAQSGTAESAADPLNPNIPWQDNRATPGAVPMVNYSAKVARGADTAMRTFLIWVAGFCTGAGVLFWVLAFSDHLR